MNDDSTYCLVLTGEGVNSVRIAAGFDAMLETLRHELWMDGDADPAEWAEWVDDLNDESSWEHHENRGDGTERFRFETDLGETGYLTIYRCDKD